MRRILTISAMAIIYFSTFVWATVINIPTDYPTIQQGMNAAVNGDTVLVQPGTYVENINFNGHNIVLGSLFLTTGNTLYILSTLIDGGNLDRVITIRNGIAPTVVGFSILGGYASHGAGIYISASNPIIANNHIVGNQAIAFGGAVHCDSNSSATFIKNKISGNWADWGGGGLYIEDCSPVLTQNNVIGNSTVAFGGGILCSYNANPLIINNIFSGNTASFGGGFCCMFTSYPIIINTILWGDSAYTNGHEVFGDDASWPTFTYCNIQNTYMPGEGNIDIDPLFRDPENGDFHLMSIACGDSFDSPCIDAGDPNILDSLLDCSWGLGGLRSDMGAYGGGDSAMVGIIDNSSFLPDEIMLMQNYPNPFNSETKIRFTIVKPNRVRLAVYDLLGREVQILVDEYMQAGFYTTTFDATDLSSGVYFCRLQAGEAIETRPMVLLR